MQLQLEVDRMRAAMDLWRQELAAKPEVDALAKLSATLGGWLDLLRLCAPGQGEADLLRTIVAEVTQLREWADEGSAALRLIKQAPDVR